MSLKVVKFKAEHWDQLTEQESMAYLSQFITEESKKAMESQEFSYTAFAGERPICCAGVVELYKGRGEAWIIIDKTCRKEFLSLHNEVKKFFETCSMRRVEATVDVDFPQGHRWMRALGFELETPIMKSYRPNGKDASMYVKVRAQ